ncbi:MAG: isoleucine--tRNA ligase [Staphylothermus sp.]|nr:isoleucine--tRNA ligase [Staphylothermus sp.]
MDLPVIGKISGQYNQFKVEEWVKKFWEENEVYRLVKEKSLKSPVKFNFIDGPPYPSGDVPHIGTAWNKTLKDVVLRYKRMRGYNVFDIPGYDCHGLPIEVKVEQKLGIKVKREIEERLGVDRFVNECKKLALTNLQSLTKWFKEIGVFMDWENPYLTLKDEYIEAGWWLIKKADEQGLLEREQRVVYWCPRCSTTLAEYEVEYHELIDPSIYVKFKVRGKENEYLLIWTTTPWTLPANTFVMAHPDEIYVRVRVGKEIYILAKARLEKVMEEAKITNYEIIEEFKGKDLEGLEYDHPLMDIVPLQKELAKYHKVVMAPEFVTTYEGTGLVHAAPGHGMEDFIVARRIGLELIASPVDDEGKFTKIAGKYHGMYVRDANPEIIKDLIERDALLVAGKIKHKYPVCWRCKTPVVMRATYQWVLRVTRLKDKLIEEVKKVNWIPEWALDRIMHMLENLQDWVLSRQRYWGTPLPIWLCPEGHKVVVGSIKELEELSGKRPKELHRPWIDQIEFGCPICGKPMKRVPDVIDVWFDSGISFFAAKGHPEKLSWEDIYMDFIVEGHDQTRGWFFSLLRSGVLGFGKAPYKNVLVHGFALDEHGREMHKSLGNYVGTDEAIRRVGRDPLRFWVLQNTVWEDLRFSWKGIEEIKRDLSIAWNTFVFASTYMNLDKYDPTEHRVEDYLEHLRPEDRWLLSRINRLVKEVTEALDNYRLHEAARKLRRFIVEDVSHWYIRLIRPRVWVEENTPDKLAAYTVLYYTLWRWLIMMAPFTPFFAEKIYQEVFRKTDPELPVSVHLLDWPVVESKYIGDELEKVMDVVREIYEASAAARMKAGIKLRQPVKSLTVYTDREEIKSIVGKYKDLITRLTNVKEVEAKPISELGVLVKYRVSPIYRILGPLYKKLAKKVIAYIEEHQEEIAKDIIAKGTHETVVEGGKITITKEQVTITPTYMEGYSVEDREWGSVAINTKLSREEIAEGLARDIVRRIQVMRKELNLPLDAKIETYIYAPKEHIDLLKDHIEYIKNETRTIDLVFTPNEEEVRNIQGYTKEWEIQGEKYIIVIRKANNQS